MSRRKKKLREDPNRIKKALAAGKIDIAEQSKWACMCDLIRFFENAKILEIMNETSGDFKRKSISRVSRFLLIYILRLFFGISSIRGMDEVLSDYGAMKLLGFEHDEIKNGITKRGNSNQYGRKYSRKSGIMDCFTVIDNLYRTQ